jgi:hypothetical protein
MSRTASAVNKPLLNRPLDKGRSVQAVTESDAFKRLLPNVA